MRARLFDPRSNGRNCVASTREALKEAIEGGKALGTSAEDWKSVRDIAMWHVESNKTVGRLGAPQE